MVKFRGKTKAGEWVEGNYLYLRHNEGREGHWIQEIDHTYLSGEGYEHKSYEVLPETVGMFTGILDKNEKEIFSSIPLENGEMSEGGDIVHGSYGIPPIGVTSVVVFEKGMFMIKTPGHKPEEINLHEAIECLDLEVIGNQTDDGHLLTQDDTIPA